MIFQSFSLLSPLKRPKSHYLFYFSSFCYLKYLNFLFRQSLIINRQSYPTISRPFLLSSQCIEHLVSTKLISNVVDSSCVLSTFFSFSLSSLWTNERIFAPLVVSKVLSKDKITALPFLASVIINYLFPRPSFFLLSKPYKDVISQSHQNTGFLKNLKQVRPWATLNEVGHKSFTGWVHLLKKIDCSE